MAEGILTLEKNGTEVGVLTDTDLNNLYVTSRPFDGGTPHLKRWQGVKVEIDNRDSISQLKLDLRFGQTIKEIEAASWIEHDASSSDGPIRLRKSGRFVQFRLRDTAPTMRWKLTLIGFYGQLQQGRKL